MFVIFTFNPYVFLRRLNQSNYLFMHSCDTFYINWACMKVRSDKNFEFYRIEIVIALLTQSA